MSLPTLAFDRHSFWRVLTPRWAFDPLSGQGAALTSGRWNANGIPAIYMSFEDRTAVTEYMQGGSRPGTLCEYFVTSDKVVDLTVRGTLEEIGYHTDDVFCHWKESAAAGRTPMTWRISYKLIDLGLHGAVFPSAAVGFRGMTVQPPIAVRRSASHAPQGLTSRHSDNLVLWSWNNPNGSCARVEVNDPTGELPVDQSSWPTP